MKAFESNAVDSSSPTPTETAQSVNHLMFQFCIDKNWIRKAYASDTSKFKRWEDPRGSVAVHNSQSTSILERFFAVHYNQSTRILEDPFLLCTLHSTLGSSRILSSTSQSEYQDPAAWSWCRLVSWLCKQKKVLRGEKQTRMITLITCGIIATHSCISFVGICSQLKFVEQTMT